MDGGWTQDASIQVIQKKSSENLHHHHHHLIFLNVHLVLGVQTIQHKLDINLLPNFSCIFFISGNPRWVRLFFGM